METKEYIQDLLKVSDVEVIVREHYDGKLTTQQTGFECGGELGEAIRGC